MQIARGITVMGWTAPDGIKRAKMVLSIQHLKGEPPNGRTDIIDACMFLGVQ